MDANLTNKIKIQDDLKVFLNSANSQIYQHSLRTLEITVLPGTGITERIKQYADQENIEVIHIDASVVDTKTPLKQLIYLGKQGDHTQIAIAIIDNCKLEMGHQLLNMAGTKDVAILYIKQHEEV